MPTPPPRYRLVVFDLDGTLVDSLEDLAAAGNHAMRAVGRPAHPIPAYRRLAGQGLASLIRDALGPDHQHLFDDAIAAQRAFYAEHAFDHTRLFDGMADLLAGLKAAGVATAVLSNKPHDNTLSVVARLCGAHAFEDVAGQRPRLAPKPAPDGLLALLDRLGVDAADAAMVGDTAADMDAAAASGVEPIGVTWGFRDAAELHAHGARELCDTVAELEAVLHRSLDA